MKKLFCMILIGITTLSFAACGNDKNESVDADDKPTIEDNNDKEDDKEESVDDDKKEDEETTDSKDDQVSKPDTKPNEGNKPDTKPDTKPEVKPEDKTERVFKVVTKDTDYKVVNGGEVKTIGLGVAENIDKILDTVSDKYFGGKDIELKTIETVKNKKIAVVNLSGDTAAWNESMQGSTGGQITEYTLIENVLQREYKGYWIDGVKFTLNGKELQSEHAPGLGKTTYR